MSKRAGNRYRGGRSAEWSKVKNRRRVPSLHGRPLADKTPITAAVKPPAAHSSNNRISANLLRSPQAAQVRHRGTICLRKWLRLCSYRSFSVASERMPLRTTLRDTPRSRQIADRLNRNKIGPADLRNRPRYQHPNLGFRDLMEANVDPPSRFPTTPNTRSLFHAETYRARRGQSSAPPTKAPPRGHRRTAGPASLICQLTEQGSPPLFLPHFAPVDHRISLRIRWHFRCERRC